MPEALTRTEVHLAAAQHNHFCIVEYIKCIKSGTNSDKIKRMPASVTELNIFGQRHIAELNFDLI